MYSFHAFKRLPAERQMDELNAHGIGLDLACAVRNAEAVLFAYNNFYVELLLECVSDEILSLTCFKSPKKLDPYLQQVDISEITVLLTYNF